MKKTALILFLFIGATSMILMSTHYLYIDDSGILSRKEISSQLWYLITFRIHVGLGLVAITLGPFQFIQRMRERYFQLHRVVGYVYGSSILGSSLAGLLIAPFAMGDYSVQ